MGHWIDDLTQEILASRNAMIDIALESAFEGGEHGVLVIEEGIEYFHVEVSPLVPFAQIFKFPSRSALEEWKRNGRPE